MDAVKSWLQDRKNLPVVVAGTAIILVAVVFLLLRLSATNSADTASMPATPPAETGAPAPAAVPGAPGAVPGAPPDAGAAVAAAPGQAKPSMLPYRKDPFKPFTRKVTQTDILISMLPSISRVRIAPAPVKRIETAEVVGETLPPQPVRRMSGVLMNSKISAILVTDGRSDVVTPGMIINRGGSRVRVESITPDQIVLKTLDTKKPFTIRVNLQGSIVSSDSDESPAGGDGAIVPM